MSHHVDFLPIGEKKCGESIVIQIGDLKSDDRSDRTVIVIDGGYKSDGEKVVDHILTHYNTDVVDLVVSTHPDQDHIGGLSTVVEKLTVRELWMHQPWKHSNEMSNLKAMNFRSENVSDKIEASLSQANSLEELANAYGVPIYEPFVNQRVLATAHGALSILGPTKEYYEGQLGQILGYTPKATNPLLNLFRAAASVFESHEIETLSEGGSTSPQNNTSTILMLTTNEGHHMLFTGDAGIEALENAHSQLVQNPEYREGMFSLVQVPHHGSRRNVSPTVLNNLLGTRTATKDEVRGFAYVSVSEQECEQGHPKKAVTNAFKRRGYAVKKTAGNGILNFSGGGRDGWNAPIEPIPHFSQVEAES